MRPPRNFGGRLGAEAAARHVGVELGEVGDADPAPDGASSTRSVLPSASTAAFDALYAPISGTWTAAPSDDDRDGVAVGVADVRAGGAERVVGAEQVHLHGPLHDRGVPADERQLGGDAGVGHDDVEPAEAAAGAVDRGLDLAAVGTSQAHHGASPPGGDLLEQVGLEAGERDPGAAVVQPLGEGGADAAGGARDEHPAPLE